MSAHALVNLNGANLGIARPEHCPRLSGTGHSRNARCGAAVGGIPLPVWRRGARARCPVAGWYQTCLCAAVGPATASCGAEGVGQPAMRAHFAARPAAASWWRNGIGRRDYRKRCRPQRRPLVPSLARQGREAPRQCWRRGGPLGQQRRPGGVRAVGAGYAGGKQWCHQHRRYPGTCACAERMRARESVCMYVGPAPFTPRARRRLPWTAGLCLV